MLERTLDIMSKWKTPWLMVFDNYDDHEAFPSLIDFMPESEFGFFLIASRHSESGLARLGKVITLEKMDLAEALTLLFNRSGMALPIPNSPEEQDARAIIMRLDYLALAIDQAGAYLRLRRLRYRDFIPNFERRKQKVMGSTPQLWGYRTDQQPISMYTIWELSWNLVKDDDPGKDVKSYLMTICAFLNFHDISEAFS